MNLAPDNPEGCVLCGVFSVQQPGARAISVITKTPACLHLVTCLNCKKCQCRTCCVTLHGLVDALSQLPSTGPVEALAIRQDKWFVTVKSLIELTPEDFHGKVIQFGSCCSFTATIPKAPHTLVMPHKSLKFVHDHGSHVLPGSDGDNSDAEYVPPREKCKFVQKVLKYGRTQNKSAVDFLHQYHDGSHLSSKSDGDNPFPCAKQINRKRRKRGRDEFSTNRYEGSLHLVQFTLILLAGEDNAHL